MKNVLIFGDSNTWGYDYTTYTPSDGTVKRLDEGKRWPGVVKQNLGAEYNIIENALNSRTTIVDDPYNPLRQGMASLKVALDANAPLDLVALHLGCNDLKHMFNLTAGMIAYGFEALVRECKTPYYGYPAPKVLVIAPPPTHPDIGKMEFGFVFGPDAYKKSLELGHLYREIAERNDCAFMDCAELGFALNTQDGLHYSVDDHARLGAVAAEKIKAILP